MANPISVIIVEKTGILKLLSIKDFKEEELFKKCGFKKTEDFIKQTEWDVKLGGTKYNIAVMAKTDGRTNSENKYEFPPPIDSTLFFGNCAIVAKDESQKYVDLSLDLWEKIYEKLFGGFEDLASTALEDELEEDELANIPKELKTKDGYLKDGFVVDSSEDDADENFDECLEIGTELSEESYDYDSEN